MSGTVTTAFTPDNNQRKTFMLCSITWESNGDGDATATIKGIRGTIERITYNPGPTAPEDNYDVTLKDQDGIDVLNGTGANLHTTNTLNTVTTINDGTTYLPMGTMGDLALVVDAAGATKNGVIRIYYRV